MPHEFTPPSKEELRKKYGITDEDFEILVQEVPTPPERLFSIDSYLESVANFLDVPTFLFRRGLCVVAVILVPYWGPMAKKKIEDCYTTTSEFWLGAFHRLPKPHDIGDVRLVAVTPGPSTLNVENASMGMFQAGTTIYFISDSAPPPNEWT